MRDKAPPKQLTFDLPLDPRFGAEDFLVSPSNEEAYALIEAWPDWPDTVFLLRGPPGRSSVDWRGRSCRPSWISSAPSCCC